MWKMPRPTLLISTLTLPAAKSLADAAQLAGWRVAALDRAPKISCEETLVYYGGTDKALEVATRFNLALLEPPFDLLAKLPIEFRRRAVEFACFGDLGRLKAPTFVKPADALNKSFDAGIYSRGDDIRAPRRVDLRSPILLSEPVEWSAEFRCFILERRLAAWSSYISFGRPSWKPFGKGTITSQAPGSVSSFCERLLVKSGIAFPPAFVMDVGMIDDRGWAVVEFNPVWCSGLLGADPSKVLAALERASQVARRVIDADKIWVIERR
jgi:hypothetical protein